MAEKEYIERGAALGAITYNPIDKSAKCDVTDLILLVAQDHIRKVPAVDVVEVVRCKDCKHWEAMDNGIGWHNEGRTDGTCKMLHEMHYAERCLTTENHFCSYGERKE